MRFFTPISLSKNQHKTPEGFLVCMGSAIARTGSQMYHTTELPSVEPGQDEMITVERDASQVFAPETIASAEGKDIVITHPDEDVTPANWKNLTVGHMQNVRRGEGSEDHLLLADLVFKDPEAIRMIEMNPNYELSCGYEAAYEILGVGRANQCNIRINHVAMVEHGRCGPVCSTKDHLPVDLWTRTTPQLQSVTLPSDACKCGTAATQKTGDSMSAKSFIDRIRDAFKTGDAAAMEEAVKDAEGIMTKTGNPEDNESHQHIHLHLGAPETTKPEGGLPETGETRVTSAKDDGAGLFGEKTFFNDKALDEAFKSEIAGMKDSIQKLCDSFEEFKKEAGEKKEEKKTEDEMVGEAKAAGTMVDEAAGEKADREIEGELKEEAPPGTGDAAMKARDSAFLEDSFAKTVQMAEILVPGIAIPTFDRAADPKASYGNMCAFRKKALTAFGATADGAAVLADIAPSLTLDSAPCREVTTVFRAAAATQKAKNMAAVTGTQDGSYFKKQEGAAPAPQSLADVQRANEAYWAAQQRAAE